MFPAQGQGQTRDKVGRRRAGGGRLSDLRFEPKHHLEKCKKRANENFKRVNMWGLYRGYIVI